MSTRSRTEVITRPWTATIKSPGRSPATSAGEPGWTSVIQAPRGDRAGKPARASSGGAATTAPSRARGGCWASASAAANAPPTHSTAANLAPAQAPPRAIANGINAPLCTFGRAGVLRVSRGEACFAAVPPPVAI